MKTILLRLRTALSIILGHEQTTNPMRIELGTYAVVNNGVIHLVEGTLYYNPQSPICLQDNTFRFQYVKKKNDPA